MEAAGTQQADGSARLALEAGDLRQASNANAHRGGPAEELFSRLPAGPGARPRKHPDPFPLAPPSINLQFTPVKDSVAAC